MAVAQGGPTSSAEHNHHHPILHPAERSRRQARKTPVLAPGRRIRRRKHDRATRHLRGPRNHHTEIHGGHIWTTAHGLGSYLQVGLDRIRGSLSKRRDQQGSALQGNRYGRTPHARGGTSRRRGVPTDITRDPELPSAPTRDPRPDRMGRDETGSSHRTAGLHRRVLQEKPRQRVLDSYAVPILLRDATRGPREPHCSGGKKETGRTTPGVLHQPTLVHNRRISDTTVPRPSTHGPGPHTGRLHARDTGRTTTLAQTHHQGHGRHRMGRTPTKPQSGPDDTPHDNSTNTLLPRRRHTIPQHHDLIHHLHPATTPLAEQEAADGTTPPQPAGTFTEFGHEAGRQATGSEDACPNHGPDRRRCGTPDRRSQPSSPPSTATSLRNAPCSEDPDPGGR
mmetsp:Transcript_27358/g.71042  ORF Transcript_27358/g.71042 Transcript_27358/m.71042 type:complete len:394 (-) Transcript_27358:120-1301(-)